MTIENHESIGSDEQQSSGLPDRPPVTDKQAEAGGEQAVEQAGEAGGKKLRGRKPKYESRATEIRHRLIAWKQTPESMRPSLRELEAETGVSHQLFSFYLKGLDKSLAKERAKQIRARAKAEGREMTMRECLDAIITPGMLDQIEKLRGEAKRGPLNRHQVQILKLHARQFPIAQEILRRCRQMTPEEERKARAAEKATMFAAAAVQNIERIKQEGERGPLRWQDIEILKLFARRKCAGAKELLQKYSKSALPRSEGVTQ